MSITSRFVGRESELSRACSIQDLTEAGRAGFVFVAGELGIGKTSFAGVVANQLAGDNGRILFQPLKSAPVPDSESISPAWPEVVGGDSPDSASSFIAALAANRHQSDVPIVVVLDDLRHAGPGVRKFLTAASEAGGLARVFIVGTYHDHLLTSRDPLRLTLSAVSSNAEVVHLRLRGLSPDECAAMFAVQTRRSLGLTARHRLAELTEGNPVIINELCIQYGLSEEDSPVAFFDAHAAEAIMMIFAEPYLAMPEPEQAVLVRAALVGRRFGLSELRAVAPDDEIATVVQAVERAQEIGLLVESAEPLHGAAGYAFTHALLPDAILGQLTAARRALLAEEVAMRLEEYYGEDASAQADRLAVLYASASNGRKATSYGLAAAEQSIRGGDYSQGLYFLEIASAALSAGAVNERAEYLLLRGQALLAMGDIEEAMRFLREAIGLFAELGQTERVLETATHAKQIQPGRTGMAALVNVAEGYISGSDPRLELQKVHSLIFESGSFEAAEKLLVDLESQTGAQPYYAIRLKILKAYLASLRRDYTAVDALLPTRPNEVPATMPIASLALETMSRSLANRGVVNQVRATLRMAVEAAEESRDRTRIQWTAHRMARFLVERAEFDAAQAVIAKALDPANTAGYLLRDAAAIAFLQDDRAGGDVYLNELMEITVPDSPADIHDATALVHAILDRNRILESEDDLETAGRLAGAVLAEAGDLPYYTFRGHAAVIRRGWLMRDADGVAEAVEVITRLGEYRLCRDHHFHYLLALGWWLLHDVDSSEGHFARAAEIARRTKDYLSLGWILLDWSMYRIERGASLRSEEVKPLLAEALAVARDLKVGPLERQVVRFVPVHASRAFTTPTGEMLTPREIEILQVLAKGKSNQAIAEHFDISKNTVANHMQRILDKTGSKNRTEAVIFAWENGIARRS